QASALMALNLKDHPLPQLVARLGMWGASEPVARRIFSCVFGRRARAVSELGELPGVTRELRARLFAEAELPALEILERRRADDGFVKYLFRSPLGGDFEAVRIPLFDTKYVVCISSQVGCAL